MEKDVTIGMWLPNGFESRNIHWSRKGLNYTIALGPNIEEDAIVDWYFAWIIWKDANGLRHYLWKTKAEKVSKVFLLENADYLLAASIEERASVTLEALTEKVEFTKY